MKKQITAVIHGNPIAKARPRFVRRGKFIKTYNPQETEEGRFMISFHDQANIQEPIHGAVAIFIEWNFQRPKSHFGTGKNSDTLKKTAPKHHCQKPDVDNLEKFVLDSLNGYAWADDCQVIGVLKSKKWVDKNPCTKIVIMEID